MIPSGRSPRQGAVPGACSRSTNLIPVGRFATGWFACPPRHLDRRIIVKRFSDRITTDCEDHRAQARTVLGGLGCTFRYESGPDLEAIVP